MRCCALRALSRSTDGTAAGAAFPLGIELDA